MTDEQIELIFRHGFLVGVRNAVKILSDMQARAERLGQELSQPPGETIASIILAIEGMIAEVEEKANRDD